MRLIIALIAFSLIGCAPRYLVKKADCEDAGEHWLCKDAAKVK